MKANSMCIQFTKILSIIHHRLVLVQLKVFKGEYVERMKELMGWKLCTTVNSDDPPFFGGYINENFDFWMEELDLSIAELSELAHNSVEASFGSKEQKDVYYSALSKYKPA